MKKVTEEKDKLLYWVVRVQKSHHHAKKQFWMVHYSTSIYVNSRSLKILPQNIRRKTFYSLVYIRVNRIVT